MYKRKKYIGKAQKAREFRQLGFSQKYICEELNVSRGFVSLCTKDIVLNKDQKRKKPILYCSFPGCKKPYCAKGLCNSHWSQRKKGHKLSPIVTHETKEERFWRQVKKSEEKDGCWVWTASESGKFAGKKDKQGYGMIYHDGKREMAHRFSFKLLKGEIGEGMQLDHLCRNKMCVNPDHLQIVTYLENMKRNKLYFTMLSEIKRLRNLILQIGEDPGADIFTRPQL